MYKTDLIRIHPEHETKEIIDISLLMNYAHRRKIFLAGQELPA